MGRLSPSFCASQTGCGAVGRPLARGKDALVAFAEQDLAAVQRQALRSVGSFGAEFLERGFAAHQSSAASADAACEPIGERTDGLEERPAVWTEIPYLIAAPRSVEAVAAGLAFQMGHPGPFRLGVIRPNR